MGSPVVTTLLVKYREIAALRKAPRPAPQSRLKQLSKRFPGALRQLDQLAPAVLKDRLETLARLEREGEVAALPDWVLLEYRYHGTLRACLRIRFVYAQRASRSNHPLRHLSGWLENEMELADDEPTRSWLVKALPAILRPPEGRLNSWAIETVAADLGLELPQAEALMFPIPECTVGDGS